MAASRSVASELTEIRVEGMTRGAFLLRATLAAGATYGAALATPAITRSVAQEGGGDVEILNFALTLEYLQAAFYARALRQVAGLGADERVLLQELHDNETAHIDALTSSIEQLGGQVTERPAFDFGRSLAVRATFLKTANTLEDTGVSAYNGIATLIASKEVLASAGSIAQVEARHAALIRLIRDRPPAPLSFDKPSDQEAVLDALRRFMPA